VRWSAKGRACDFESARATLQRLHFWVKRPKCLSAHRSSSDLHAVCGFDPDLLRLFGPEMTGATLQPQGPPLRRALRGYHR